MGKAIRSPQIASENWASRTSGASEFYKSQVQASSWKVFAASDAAEKNYATGVNEAVTKKSRQAGVNASSDSAWQTGVSTVGATRFSAGVGASKPKMDAVMSKLIPAIDNARKSLPARGVSGSQDNKNRVLQMIDKMHAQKGTFKARGVSRSA